MSQYLLSVHMVEGAPPRPVEEMQRAYARVTALNTELQSAGSWVFAGGLHPPSTATVVQLHGGEVVTTDGPFAEGKEHLGGVWIIDAKDLDEALSWARKATVACGEPVEVRPFQEIAEDPA